MNKTPIPTFESSPLPAFEADEQLKANIADFFSTRSSRIINYEAGGGKTKCMIEAVCDRLIAEPMQKMAVFVPTHQLARQLKEDIRTRLTEKFQVAQTPKERIKAKTSVRVQHIEGRNTENCRHPLQQQEDYEASTAVDQGMIDLFRNYTAKFCLACPLRQSCKYIEQFNNIRTNVRIYTREELFNASSLWSAGQDWGGAPKKDVWTPDFIIVDEDIIEIAVDKWCVTKVAFSNCDDSPAGLLIKDIIHGHAKSSLEQLIYNKRDELAEIYKQQKNDHKQWNKKYPFPKIQGQGSQETIDYVNLREANKPRLYPVIDQLYEYSLELSQADKPDDLKNDALFVEENTIWFAGRKSIKPQFSEIPILLLDATANQSIANAIFSHPFDYQRISIAYQDNMKVFQFKNKSFSKNQLQDCDAEGDSRDQQNVETFIRRKSKGKKFGIITYMNLKSELHFDKRLAVSVGADVYGHFGNIRGLNDFEDLDQLYIIGRHFLPSSALELRYRQIFGGVRIGNDCPSFEKARVNQVFRMSNGTNEAVYQWVYVDEQVQALDHFLNRSETYQAAHRLRLIYGDQPKELYLMTNQVLDITVDELLDAGKEFGRAKPKREEKIVQVVNAIKKHGVLLDTNKAIRGCTMLTADDMKNLRRNGGFLTDVLNQDGSIQHETIQGEDKHGHIVSRSFFRDESVDISDEVFLVAVNLSRFRTTV